MSTFQLNNSMFLKPLNLPPSAWIGHIPFAGWIMEAMRPATFVELGTHTGTSYLAFCQAVQENNLPSKCFAVDTWEGDQHAGAYQEDIYEVLRATHDGLYGGLSQLMRMTFDEALSYFEDGSIDLLHIDGLHTYDAVSHDFDSWLPKLSDRGVVLFHDTMVRERDFGVWKLWSELRQRYPSFEFQHSHGLGVLLVGKDPPAPVLALTATDAGEQKVFLRLFERTGTAIGSISTNATGPAELEGLADGDAPSRELQTFLKKQLNVVLAQLAAVNLQLGKADAFAKTQTAEVQHLMQEIADREDQIKLLNGQVADGAAELAKASEHLLAADQNARAHIAEAKLAEQNARAHVAESRLVQHDIQDLQREIAARGELIERLQVELRTCQDQVAGARPRNEASDDASAQDDAPR